MELLLFNAVLPWNMTSMSGAIKIEAEREELPVMEVQHQARFNGALSMGIYTRRSRNSPGRNCNYGCEECFLIAF